MNRKKLSSFGFAGLFETGDVTTFFYCRNVLRSRKDERSSEFFRVYPRGKEEKYTGKRGENEDASVKRHWHLLPGWNSRLLRLEGVWEREREINNVNSFPFILSLSLSLSSRHEDSKCGRRWCLFMQIPTTQAARSYWISRSSTFSSISAISPTDVTHITLSNRENWHFLSFFFTLKYLIFDEESIDHLLMSYSFIPLDSTTMSWIW